MVIKRSKKKGTTIIVGFKKDSPLARFKAKQERKKGRKVEFI